MIADETTKASDVEKEEEVSVINEEDLPECSESDSTSDDEPKPYNPVFASNMDIASTCTCKRIHYAECKGRPRRIRTKVRSNPPPKPSLSLPQVQTPPTLTKPPPQPTPGPIQIMTSNQTSKLSQLLHLLRSSALERTLISSSTERVATTKSTVSPLPNQIPKTSNTSFESANHTTLTSRSQAKLPP